MKATMKLLVAMVAGASLLCTTLFSVADAAMIGTQSAVSMGQRAQYTRDIKRWLTRDDVRKQLVQLGVNPSDASARVSALTPQELSALHQRINELPAGGGLFAFLGILFVVLVVLELVGVTHVFTHF